MVRVTSLVGIGAVASIIAAVAATHHANPADGSPIDPSGGWGVVWVAALICAFAFYGLGVLIARRRLVLWIAISVAVAVQIAPLAGPLLLSRDVYLYWAEARVVTVHHANPYVATPSRYAEDPGTREASAQWRTQPEPYGPGWVALGALPTLVAGNSHTAVQFLYRILATIGMLGGLAILACRTRSARSVVFLGWNPLLALHFAGGGHSDVWIALAMVVTVAWRNTSVGGAAWSIGSSLKGVPALLLPLELARARGQLSRRFWVSLAGTGLAIVVAATAIFGPRWSTASLIGAHGTSPIGGVHFLTEAGLRHRYAVLIGAAVFVSIYAILVREAWQHARARLSLAASALCMCSSLLRPWYAIWPVALAAVEEDGLAEAAAFALSVYVLFADAIPL